MSDAPLPVLFLLGSGRNGSTVLANLLGSANGVANVGEIHWIWERGVAQNRLCGCGEPFLECPFWGAVLSPAEEQAAAAAHEAGRRATLEGLRPLRLVGRHWTRRASEAQRRYVSRTDRLYRAVASVADAGVLVDSSKRPVYAFALTKAPSLDVYVVHLVRDPRAVVFSWRRRKVNPDIVGGGLMAVHPAWKTAAGWTVWNLMAELLGAKRRGRYLRIRYEDFVADPLSTLQTIGDLVGTAVAPDFTSPTDFEVEPSHSISGNPSRFDVGTVRLSEDIEWIGGIGRRDRITTTVLTWPLMLRYRYPLRRRSGSGR
ncbi:MAG TPA: sulfotransferase [Acidimicrobiia bacterium]|jgi:hypothetical protein